MIQEVCCLFLPGTSDKSKQWSIYLKNINLSKTIVKIQVLHY